MSIKKCRAITTTGTPTIKRVPNAVPSLSPEDHRFDRCAVETIPWPLCDQIQPNAGPGFGRESVPQAQYVARKSGLPIHVAPSPFGSRPCAPAVSWVRYPVKAELEGGSQVSLLAEFDSGVLALGCSWSTDS